MTLHNVPVTGFAELLINAGDGPTLVINRDITTALYIGDDNSVVNKGGTGQIDIIDPLGVIQYDGKTTKYAVAAPGGNNPITIDCVKGANSWQPSPAQTAAQINALGLAKDTTVAGVTSTLGLGTNPPLQAINGNHTDINGHNSNPLFTSPSGVADTTGWSNGLGGNQGTLQSAGPLGAVALPAGSGNTNGAFFTPGGGTTTEEGMQLEELVPCSSGDTLSAHLRVWFTTNTPATFNIEFSQQYFDINGAFLTSVSLLLNPAKAGRWLRQAATFKVPVNAGIAFAGIGFGFKPTGGSTVLPAANSFYVSAFHLTNHNISGTVHTNTAIARSVNGTPLLHGLTNRYNATSTVAHNATGVIGPLTITKPGYVISLSVTIPNTATASLLGVQFIWKDSFTGVQTDEEHWYIPMAASGTLPVYGQGPTKGDQLTVNLVNFDGAQTATVTMTIWDTTHHIARDDWRGTFFPGIISGAPFTNGAQLTDDAFSLFLGEVTAFNIAAATTALFGIPLYCGQISISIGLSVAGNTNVKILAMNPKLAGNFVIYSGTANALTNPPIIVSSPRSILMLSINNTTAGGILYTIGATGLEYAS